MNAMQVYKVARREFLARVRNRAFILMTILVPAVLGAYMVSIPLLGRSTNTDSRLAIVDAGTGLGAAIADRVSAIPRPHVTVSDVESVAAGPAEDQARQTLNDLIRRRDIDGYLVVEPDAENLTKVRYFAREVGNTLLLRELRLAVQSAMLGRLLAGTGVDPAEVRKTQLLNLDAVTVSDRGERAGGLAIAVGSTMALAMLLYVSVLINGQGMATAIVEEKSLRLVEVILSAVTSTEFVAGKILGVLGSGVLQLGVWILVVLVAVLGAAPALAVSGALSGVNLAAILTPRLIFYFAVFFALGYALYSILFAVIAVTCTSTEELGQSMLAAILPMVVGMMVAVNTIANPATPATRVLSLIPFFTPLVMMARVNVLMPPLWEVWLGIALLAASALAASWVASKVFRYALLMTGKRPTLPELIAVVRAG